MTSSAWSRARVAWATLLVGWCAATWLLSAQSDPETYVGIRLRIPDKLEHAIEYAVGGFLATAVAVAPRRIPAWAAAIGFCALWGTLDEVHQRFVPGRDASVLDVAADLTGGAIGAAAFTLWTRRRAPAHCEVAGTTRTNEQRRRT